MSTEDDSTESVSAVATIEASAGAVFAVLADPSTHAGIDGTGWVTGAVDTEQLTGAGQLFRMSMYHRHHPDGSYETVNEVTVHEPGRALAWRTGWADEAGTLTYGGWWWRHDLEPLGPARTRVRLTYDWSAVGPGPREYLSFPPFAPDHLERSLGHLADAVLARGS